MSGKATGHWMPPLQPDKAKNSSVSLASFYLNSDRYTDGTLQISGPEHYEVYIDNEKQTPANGELKLTLEPRRYEVVIKYLTAPDETNHIPKVTFKTDSKAVVTATTDPEKRYTLSDVFDGTRIRSVSLSPNGKYLLTAYQTTYPGGDTESFQQVTDRATGQVLMESNNHHYSWMPRSNRLYYTRKGMRERNLSRSTLQPKQRSPCPQPSRRLVQLCPDRGFPAVQHHRGRTEERGRPSGNPCA